MTAQGPVSSARSSAASVRCTSSWWPVSHTVTAEPGLQVVFEGRPGGRIFERTPSSREVSWGQVTVWEPPRRLCYLWHIRADRADATEVEIRFHDRGMGSTRVEIEHRGWEVAETFNAM